MNLFIALVVNCYLSQRKAAVLNYASLESKAAFGWQKRFGSVWHYH